MYDNRTTVWKPQHLSNMIHVVQHLEGVEQLNSSRFKNTFVAKTQYFKKTN